MSARRVVVVAFPGMQPLDAVGPAEVFHTAARLRPGAYEVTIAAPEREPIPASAVSLMPDASLASLRGPVDTLVVAGGAGVLALERDDVFLATLRGVAARSRRTAGVCTGAFLLAAAGLLDGRRATTHWASCDVPRRALPGRGRGPRPDLRARRRRVHLGGVTAGMDLALALVEEDLGRETALETARWLVLFVKRPGGQAQFSAQLTAQIAERRPLRELQAWIADNLDADLVGARRSPRARHMSERNFARAFAREVGMTPAAYVEAARVESARIALEAGETPRGAGGRAVPDSAPSRPCAAPFTAGGGWPRRLPSPLPFRQWRHEPRQGDPDGHRDPAVRPLHRPGRRRSLRGALAPPRRARDLRRAWRRGPTRPRPGCSPSAPTPRSPTCREPEVIVVPGGTGTDDGAGATSACGLDPHGARDVRVDHLRVHRLAAARRRRGARGPRGHDPLARPSELERFGATPTERRVVEQGKVITGRGRVLRDRHGAHARRADRGRGGGQGDPARDRVRPRAAVRLGIHAHRVAGDDRAGARRGRGQGGGAASRRVRRLVYRRACASTRGCSPPSRRSGSPRSPVPAAAAPPAQAAKRCSVGDGRGYGTTYVTSPQRHRHELQERAEGREGVPRLPSRQEGQVHSRVLGLHLHARSASTSCRRPMTRRSPARRAAGA